MKYLNLFVLLLTGCLSWAQSAFAPSGYLTAKWIQPADTRGQNAYGVYHFRKNIMLDSVPRNFKVHVSGDNRYRFFVNGQEVGIGPARGDTQHWYYDTYDLAPMLKPGPNILAAQVWNMGDLAPVAQMSFQTGFLVQGNSAAESVANTDKSWKVLTNKAYQPILNDPKKLHTYIVVGPGDQVDAAQYPWNWQAPDYDDSYWPNAVEFWFTAKLRTFGTDGNWALMQRTIPPLWSCPERLVSVRRTTGEVNIPAGFVTGNESVKIEPGKKVTILFDEGHLTNGYPELLVSGGKGARIQISYAEGLMNSKRQKIHRDSINGLQLIGFSDAFLPDGGAKRLFRPLWFRTWRYLQLDIETKDQALVLEDLHSIFSGYPFQENASFRSNDTTLTDIWEVGWRTARLCAMETYFDCPYYEQLQYTGDTRIQSLISLYVSGDDRLMRKAIQDFADSRMAEGLTQSRYPCNDPQFIPPFSLFWVSMVHDYWMHRQDDVFVKKQLDGIRSVLAWHQDKLADNQMNGLLPWWNFTDWSWPWNENDRIGGVPPGARGGSAILSLQFAYTLDQAADLYDYYKQPAEATAARNQAQRIKQAVYSLCWDKKRSLLADTPDHLSYSQHANIWGVLTDAIPVAEQQIVLNRIMTEKDITQATFYFRFYLFECLKKTGMGDRLLSELEPWREMLRQGLTTFAEGPDPARSDCHAWSASPNYELLSMVCGINPSKPGFGQVKIEPYLGRLNFAEGRMPHPNGEIKVVFIQKQGVIAGLVHLPPGLTGTFHWKGKVINLVSGDNEIIEDARNK